MGSPFSERYDALVFAAVGAFVALRRPGREDADRLDALAMPLFSRMSSEGKRLTAAVLSEAREVVPDQLIEALAMEPLEISASLLISRAGLSDGALMRIMAARGEGHARIIRLRKSIGETMTSRIDDFIEAITPLADISIPDPSQTASLAEPAGATDAPTSASAPPFDPVAAARLDVAETRDALRRLMMRQTIRPDIADRMVVDEGPQFNLVARLINLALAGDPDLLATAVADELRLPFAPVRRIVRRKDIMDVMLMLKAMELGATDCFAIVAALRPLAFATAEAIARFHLAFQAADDAAIGRLIATLDDGASGKAAQRA